MRLPKELFVLLVCVLQGQLGRANTEIVNFAVSLGPDTPVPQAAAWPTLSPGDSERLFALAPAPLGSSIVDVCEPVTSASLTTGAAACPHELWLVLGTDEESWAGFDKFTLRVSWPASSPADFWIETYSPDALYKVVQGGDSTATTDRPPSERAVTRRTFARIRAIDTGVLTPSPAGMNASAGREAAVSFIVTAEPLHFGVLPATVVPTVLMLVAVAVGAVTFVLPTVSKYLTAMADAVREEAASAQREARKVE